MHTPHPQCSDLRQPHLQMKPSIDSYKLDTFDFQKATVKVIRYTGYLNPVLFIVLTIFAAFASIEQI